MGTFELYTCSQRGWGWKYVSASGDVITISLASKPHGFDTQEEARDALEEFLIKIRKRTGRWEWDENGYTMRFHRF